jgi:hypothetical protein
MSELFTVSNPHSVVFLRPSSGMLYNQPIISQITLHNYAQLSLKANSFAGALIL